MGLGGGARLEWSRSFRGLSSVSARPLPARHLPAAGSHAVVRSDSSLDLEREPGRNLSTARFH